MMFKNCRTCGKQFNKPSKYSEKQWVNKKFCSKTCIRKKDLDLDGIKSNYEKGLSSTEVGEMYNISPTHILRILKSIKVPIRSVAESNKIVMSKPEVKKRMSDASKGRIFKESSKEKLRNITGDRNKNWNGGLTFSNGYICFTSSSANGDHKNKALHVVVAEWAFGRKVKSGEHVHHIDGDKLNNRPSNLIILSASEHAKLHTEDRKK